MFLKIDFVTVNVCNSKGLNVFNLHEGMVETSAGWGVVLTMMKGLSNDSRRSGRAYLDCKRRTVGRNVVRIKTNPSK